MLTAPNPAAADAELRDRTTDLMRVLALVRELLATRADLERVGLKVDDIDLLNAVLYELSWRARGYREAFERLNRTIASRNGERTPSALPSSFPKA